MGIDPFLLASSLSGVLAQRYKKKDVKISFIDHNPSWKENQRHTRESFWIRDLQTLLPEGINKKDL
jgi:type II secretory ATPase GspE/PulE/Tfp pilus assembly ATPase PilB-like protein